MTNVLARQLQGNTTITIWLKSDRRQRFYYVCIGVDIVLVTICEINRNLFGYRGVATMFIYLFKCFENKGIQN
jgi:hypothetical protein